ncbi:MAG: phage holin family protein [Gemmatimonadota bacterium]|nr:phage holin family protein [Gemmatimonadota bacterium]
MDPDAKITELVRRLTDDSKKLVGDEIRLSKLEMKDNIRGATKGAIQLGLAFGIGLLTMVSLTIFLVTAIGSAARGHIWVGAIVTGMLELGVGGWLMMRGLSRISSPSYSLGESRAELQRTKEWLRHPTT